MCPSTTQRKYNWIYTLRGPFTYRDIVIMWSWITSYFIYSDWLFFYHSVYLTLPLYLLSLIFTSRSPRSPFIISSFHIFLFILFRTLLLCPLKSFWLSYSVPQSKFQSYRFFYPYSFSHSLSLSSSVFSWYVTLPSSIPFYVNICNNIILFFRPLPI